MTGIINLLHDYTPNIIRRVAQLTSRFSALPVPEIKTPTFLLTTSSVPHSDDTFSKRIFLAEIESDDDHDDDNAC